MQLQENAKEGYTKLLDQYVSGSGSTERDSDSAEIKGGLFVVEPTIDNTTPSATIVSEGYVYLNGEIMYFAGGTFDLSFSGTDFNMLVLTEGSDSLESRVFNDGGTRDILITKTVSTDIVNFDATTGKADLSASIGVNDQICTAIYTGLFQTIYSASGQRAIDLGLDSRISDLEGITEKEDSGWTNVDPSFNNGDIVVASIQQPAYRRDAIGNVHLRGVISYFLQTGFSDSRTFFTLPSGYRPSGATLRIPCAYNSYIDDSGSESADKFNNIQVQTSGGVAANGVPGETMFFFLDGISFFGDN